MGPLSTADTSAIDRFRAASGSRRHEVFEEIFQSHRDRVYRLCLRLCGDRSLAEDALQETFLGVYKSLHAFRGDSELFTWIHRLAIRTCWRLRARNPAAAPPAAEVVGSGGHPDAALFAREQARLLQSALDGLPAEQRVVFAMAAAGDLNNAQIATILGIPEGTVWSRLHKARKALAPIVQ